MTALAEHGFVVDRRRADSYRRWSERVPAATDPYYSENAVRFELRDADVLLVPSDVVVRPADCGVSMVSAAVRAEVLACGVSVADASAVLAAVNGVRTAAEVRAASRVGGAAWQAFSSRAFGVLLFAPLAVRELEARVSGAEIVRFPGSPYSIVRSYWANMAELAERTADFSAELRDVNTFLRFLGELHTLALIGKDGESFYRPRSAVAEKNPADPFGLWKEASVTEETARGTRFVSGPRVNATSIGGERYQALLAASLGDPGALLPARALSQNELSMGRLVTARADGDAAPAPWFCPPRPQDVRHFDVMRTELARAVECADSRARSQTAAHLGAFHWSFVRVHPFPFANQSVAMSLVNAVLRRVRRSGTPHLILDHLALRFDKDAYVRAFERGVDAWDTLEPSAAERLFSLMDRKRRAFEFLDALGRDASNPDQPNLLNDRAGDAKLVLLAHDELCRRGIGL